MKQQDLRAKRDEMAQAHYDKRANLFNVQEFDRETIAVESFKLGFDAAVAIMQEELIEHGNILRAEIFDHAKTEELLSVAKEALQFYADPKKWAEFISGGNVFDEQEGDFVEAFNGDNGPDEGSVAREALAKLEGKE